MSTTGTLKDGRTRREIELAHQLQVALSFDWQGPVTQVNAARQCADLALGYERYSCITCGVLPIFKGQWEGVRCPTCAGVEA